MISRCEFLNSIPHTADKRQAIADYSVEEYMDYIDKFDSMECGGSIYK